MSALSLSFVRESPLLEHMRWQPCARAIMGLLWAGITGACLAQDPLTIENVTDRAVYDRSTWFRVPSQSGYQYRVELNGKPVPTDLIHAVETADYHELSVTRLRASDGRTTNRLVRFIVQSERGSPERGLPSWSPYPPVDSSLDELAGAMLRTLMPPSYPAGLPIPVIVWVENTDGRTRRVNGTLTDRQLIGGSFRVLRGVGSGFLASDLGGSNLTYRARLRSLETVLPIQLEASVEWLPMRGVLGSRTAWPAGARIHVVADITVPADGSLWIHEGCVVKIDPLVNVHCHGRLHIEGTQARPVVLTSTNLVWPEVHGTAWGGLLLRGSNAMLEANHAVILGGGGAERFSFSPGAAHRSEQAVLLLHSGARASLTNCAVINTAGQVGNGYQSDLTLDHCLLQRAITAGEYVGGNIVIRNSALIEFPAEDAAITEDSADADYDAIYFTEGKHVLEDSLIGFCLDDAIDSGSGGAGTVLVTNCWVESALHEALAWSGEGRRTWTYSTVTMNSGQGIECGWSTGSDSPDCDAEHLLSLGNAVGARFGDNYDWSYNGRLRLTSSLLLHNGRDVFLKTWNAPGSGWQAYSWEDRLAQTDFRSNRVTQVSASLPGNTLWKPADEGARLIAWQSTPPDAIVGVGWALRAQRVTLLDAWQGIPVRLSHFSTNRIEARVQFQDGSAKLAATNLVFAPGETVKLVYPVGFDLLAREGFELVLEGVHGAEVTGLPTVSCVGASPIPRVSFWCANHQLSPSRLAEGMFLKLSSPSGLPVTVDYVYLNHREVVERGVALFVPGATVAWIAPPIIAGTTADTVQLRLNAAEHARLDGWTSVAYGTPPLEVGFADQARQRPLAALAMGTSVRLSRPVAERVELGFRCEGSGQVLTNGVVVFAPGEEYQRIFCPSVDTNRYRLLRLTIKPPLNLPLLSPADIIFLPIEPSADPEIVDERSLWRFADAGVDLGTAWREPDYDDSAWSVGPAELGFGDGDEATVLRRENASGEALTTAYFRQRFLVDHPSAFTNLVMTLRRDDGGIVYLNGQELFRSPTFPKAPAVVTHQSLANQTPDGSAPDDNSTDTVAILPSRLLAGGNLIAVEVHQFSRDSSDLSFALTLRGEPIPMPATGTLQWGVFGGETWLVWSDPEVLLETGSQVNGPWRRLPLAQSPWKLEPVERGGFYRLVRL